MRASLVYNPNMPPSRTEPGAPPDAANPTVYFRGHELYAAMLADIARAVREICLEMYIFDDDDDGRRFRDALIDRARAGLRVRVMYDSLGCLDTPPRFFETMRHAGIEVAEFNPIVRARVIRQWRKIDRRNHRKLLVVDARVAYLGGINISASLAHWEDAHVRVEGRLATQARDSFEKVWGGRYPRVALRRSGRRALHAHRSVILDGFPAPHFSPLKRAHMHLFQRARQRIRIAHAYFIPDRRILRTLRKAVRRGADVDVLVPAHSDVTAIDWAMRYALGRLLRGGARVRFLPEPIMHTKAVVADDRYAIVGSANLNRTSFFRTLEIVLWTHDEGVVQPLVNRFEMLWARATPYTVADDRRRPWWRRLLSWLAYRVQFWFPADQAW